MGVSIVFNDEGFRAVLQSPAVLADLERRGQAIAAAAGPGQWDVKGTVGPNRARVSVGTGDATARKAEATQRALTSALDAGR